MSKSAFIRARIEPNLKEHVEKILMQIGLNQTEAIKLFYKQIELCHGLPFRVEIPNRQTLKAIRDSVRGENQKRFSSVDELFEDLGD